MTVHRPAWRALEEDLEALEASGLLRELRQQTSPVGATVTLEGRDLVNFGSNNYLDLATHPEVIDAACAAARRYGTGAGASRLVSGNHVLYAELETAIARLKGTEAALVFPTGYATALGTVASLVGEGDMVVSDRLNHASLIDACRLSRARLFVYPHGDARKAASILDGNRGRYRRALLVTDGLFSMDGDVAPLGELTKAADRTESWLLVDDAHGTGVLGGLGRGSFEEAGVDPGEGVIQMGTLSKALGSVGGYVAAAAAVRETLVNRARTLIFSTGLPPSAVAAATAAIGVAERESWRRERVKANAGRMRSCLSAAGFKSPAGTGPVVPVMAGGGERAMRWMRELGARGFYAPGIRPPSVPAGKERLRVSLMATHTESQIEGLVEALAAAGAEAAR